MAETLVYTPENQANNMLPYFLAGQNNGNGFFGGNGGSSFWGAASSLVYTMPALRGGSWRTQGS